jgi:hypothetical protein
VCAGIKVQSIIPEHMKGSSYEEPEEANQLSGNKGTNAVAASLLRQITLYL